MENTVLIPHLRPVRFIKRRLVAVAMQFAANVPILGAINMDLRRLITRAVKHISDHPELGAHLTCTRRPVLRRVEILTAKSHPRGSDFDQRGNPSPLGNRRHARPSPTLGRQHQ